MLHLGLAVPPRQGRPARADARDPRRRLRGRLAFCNQVGGQDELVFDGRSALFDAAGELVARAPQFEEHLLVADVDIGLSARRRLREPLARRLPTPADGAVTRIAVTPAERNGAVPADGGSVAAALRDEPEVWAALRTGLRDYVDKNRFPGVLVGRRAGSTPRSPPPWPRTPSGRAGHRRRDAVLPLLAGEPRARRSSPSRWRSACSSCRSPRSPRPSTRSWPRSSGREPDITEENLQARARGTLLMALSNKLGLLVLATGNKSEISVGYSTLYGDMVGGFAPSATSPRPGSTGWPAGATSEGREVIPEATIARPPTAELRPGQLDTDSLPPYDVLDAILEGYVEQGLEPDDLVRRGHPEPRRRGRPDGGSRRVQATSGAVGIKITPRAFGRDRRMPITIGHLAHRDGARASHGSGRLRPGVGRYRVLAVGRRRGGRVRADGGRRAPSAGHLRWRPVRAMRRSRGSRGSGPSIRSARGWGWSVTPGDPPARATGPSRGRACRAPSGRSPAAPTSIRRPPPPAPLEPAPAFTDLLFTPVVQWGSSPAGRPGGELYDARRAFTHRDPRQRLDGTHEEWAGDPELVVAPRSTLRARRGLGRRRVGARTHVAGIAAAPPTASGIVGVAPARAGAAEDHPGPDRRPRGAEQRLTMIRGIRHAVRNGAKVVNISAAGTTCRPSRTPSSGPLARARWWSHRSATTTATRSTTRRLPPRRRGGRPVRRPRFARLPRPFGVAEFSNRNRSVDVIAPGVNVLSSVPRRVTARAVRPGYALKDGTSMSAPYVAGVAALVMASNGNALSPGQVLRQIENTAVDRAPAATTRPATGPSTPGRPWCSRHPRTTTRRSTTTSSGSPASSALSQIREPLAVDASIDNADDRDDVYAVRMNRRERVRVRLVYGSGRLDLSLWRPGTTTVRTASPTARRNFIAARRGVRKARRSPTRRRRTAATS